MVSSLQNKVAIVTGGASGIGAACVEQLVARGASVVIADRSLEAAQATAARYPSGVAAVQADVSKEDDCRTMVAFTLETFGRLDIAINNAGVSTDPTPLTELPLDSWQRVIDINLNGVFLCMKAEIPAMLNAGGGAIVNVASVMGTVAVPRASAYVASKHAVVGLTKAAALEYASENVRINAVGPGFVETPLLRDATRANMDNVIARHPIGRIATAQDIANVVLFLASPEAAFVTGSYYIADGGYTAS